MPRSLPKGDIQPRYYTILVALTQQDEYTGGTEVWPGTHRHRSMFCDQAFEDIKVGRSHR